MRFQTRARTAARHRAGATTPIHAPFHVFCFAFALAVTLSLAPPALAQADGFGFAGFDLRFGAVVPLEDWDPGYRLGGSVNFAEVSEGVYLFPSAGFARVSSSEGPVELTLSDLSFGLETRHFPSGSPSGWFYGGGPALHFVDLDTTISGNSVGETVSSSEIGASVVLGYALGERDSGFNLEGRGSWVDGFNSVQLLVGYRFGKWSPNPLE